VVDGIAAVLVVGVAASLLTQKIIQRLDNRAFRKAGTTARLIILLAFLIGTCVQSLLIYRAWEEIGIFWLVTGETWKVVVALALPAAVVVAVALVCYFLVAPEAFCRPARRDTIGDGKPVFQEDIAALPLALATGCVPVGRLKNGTVLLLSTDCPDRAVYRMLQKRLGKPLRYIRATGDHADFLKEFYKTHGENFRPVKFESAKFLDRPESIEMIERGMRPDDTVGNCRVPDDSVLLVAVSVFYYSRKLYSFDPLPLFGADWECSYWPYFSVSLSEGRLALAQDFTSHAPPAVPPLLIFEQRLVDGDAHGYGIRLVDPKKWNPLEPPSDYRVAGLNGDGHLVMEIAGKAKVIPPDEKPGEFYDDSYFVLHRGKIFRRRLRLSVLGYWLVPRDKVILGDPDFRTPSLHESLPLPSTEKMVGI
jgi:hypothetical protein